MKIKFYLLSLINSIFYFGIQSVIGLEASKISGGNIFYYPLIISTFLIFTAIGIYAGSRIQFSKLKTIFFSELFLIILGNILIPTIYVIHSFKHFSLLYFYIPYSIIFAFFSGISLYLITTLRKDKNTFFILDYLGSFISTILIIVILRYFLSNIQIITLLSTISLIILYKFSKKIKLFFIINTLIALYSNQIENNLIRLSMNKFGNTAIHEKFTTSYQDILLIENKEYYFGFLNNQIQFSVEKNSNLDEYHEKMKKTLKAHNFQKVLILGGGDGLPSKIIFELNKNAEITLIDIDEKWVEFSKRNPIMQKINNKSLEKTTILYQDAFNLKKINQKFDLIIIDFPEGDDFSAYRVHSIEYFNQLRSHLSADGIILSQEDFSNFNPHISNLITNTAYKSNLYPILIKDRSIKKPIIQYIFTQNEISQNNIISLIKNAKKPIIYNNEYISNNQNNILKYKLYEFLQGLNEK